VAAKNKWGTGSFSSAFTIIAYKTTDAPSAAVTTVDGTNVKITWNEPDSSVTEYEILIETSVSGTFVEHADCEGDDATILDDLECFVPMADFLAAPYSLSRGDLIVVKVRANNPIGWSSYSAENTSGAEVETVPSTMSSLARGSETSTVQIEVDWTALTLDSETGGSDITTYWLQYDKGTNEVTWYTLAGETTDYDQTSFIVDSLIVGGTVYKFRIKAGNVHGLATSFSSSFSIEASDVPDAPAAPVVAI